MLDVEDTSVFRADLEVLTVAAFLTRCGSESYTEGLSNQWYIFTVHDPHYFCCFLLLLLFLFFEGRRKVGRERGRGEESGVGGGWGELFNEAILTVIFSNAYVTLVYI